MEKELQIQVTNTLTELIQLLKSVDDAKFNVVPFEGSWTAGQLAKHMIMSNSGFVTIMTGPLKDTERKPDQHVEEIRSAFLNFNIKMESPEVIRPPKIIYSKTESVYVLTDIKEKLYHTIETSDLTKTGTAFEVPVLGYLTGLEAAQFVLVHTQRHVHQLKKILNKLATNNNVSIS